MATPSSTLPCPPTELEQNWYYYGLQYQPKLVARSSTVEWGSYADPWLIPKYVGIPASHKIFAIWHEDESPLKHQIFLALHNEHVLFNAVGIVKIGYLRVPYGHEEPEQHTTLSVSVEPGSMTWADGFAVATQCRSILQQHGIDDVHCEIQESPIYPKKSARRDCALALNKIRFLWPILAPRKTRQDISPPVQTATADSTDNLVDAEAPKYYRPHARKRQFGNRVFSLPERRYTASSAEPSDKGEDARGYVTD